MALWNFLFSNKNVLNSKRKNKVISWETEFIPHSAATSEAQMGLTTLEYPVSTLILANVSKTKKMVLMLANDYNLISH